MMYNSSSQKYSGEYDM